MSDAKPASRRRHDADLKRQVIAACAAPGASVAQVAMSYGLNANLVHKWRRVAGHDGEPAGTPAFVPVSVVTEAEPCEPRSPSNWSCSAARSMYGCVGQWRVPLP
ncbi:transposase, partial [Mitsuaria sp. CC2]|uniref:IS66-like element accessory protein TnpA n=1 Tax=Mitsuaria sp. CC2 TaxID=3029186 RepID=UPI003B8D0A76